MKMDELRGDLIAVGALYFVINIFIILVLQLHQLSVTKHDLLLSKTLVVELDSENDDLRYIISELNNYIDVSDKRDADTLHSDRLLKDLR